MSDLFISYRREDGGWAGRLYGDLEQAFDVFFDTSRNKIDLGDLFPQQIDDALAECRVCIVVIGPEWANEKNLQRLADPEDWVRREIELALQGHPRIRTVPVFTGKAGVPDETRLPASLRPLFAHNGGNLTNENWKNDCQELIERANGWLKGVLPLVTARRNIPAFLPYLCDRVAQQDSLIDLVAAGKPGAPVYACVVHGHKLEFHESFLQRIRYHRLLEDLFNARDIGVASCALQWNRDKARAGQCADVLRRAFKAAAMQRAAASDADLMEYLRALAQPMVATMQVTWPDYAYCGPELVPGLIDAWRALFVDAASAAGASRTITMPALLWINLTYDDEDGAVADAGQRLSGVLLPRLQPVTQGDIADWLMVDEVKRATVGFEAPLLALTDDPKSYIEVGKLHMQRFVDEVRRIVVRA
ncbi:MAG: TIR domain-containing protein [Casimicrobiaceae bacterium]